MKLVNFEDWHSMKLYNFMELLSFELSLSRNIRIWPAVRSVHLMFYS